MVTSAARGRMPTAQGTLYAPSMILPSIEVHLTVISEFYHCAEGIHSLAAEASLPPPPQAPGFNLGWGREEEYQQTRTQSCASWLTIMLSEMQRLEYIACVHVHPEDRWASAEKDASLPEKVLLPRPTHAFEVRSFLPCNIQYEVQSIITYLVKLSLNVGRSSKMASERA